MDDDFPCVLVFWGLDGPRELEWRTRCGTRQVGAYGTICTIGGKHFSLQKPVLSPPHPPKDSQFRGVYWQFRPPPTGSFAFALGEFRAHHPKNF